MKIYSWNVNGIRAVHRKGLLEPFFKSESPDIVCIQETKAQPNQFDMDFEGYTKHWNSAEKKGYSGTAIYTKVKPLNIVDDIPEKYVKESGLTSDGYGDANKEGRVISAEYEDFYLVSAYTPNSKDKLARIILRQDWDRALASYCADLQKSKPVIYCGDMNVAHTEDDLARPGDNKGNKGFSDEERAGFDNWLNAGFVDTFRMFTKGNGHYSWWTPWAQSRERNVGWRIDYFLVSESIKGNVKAAKIHADIMGSDHCPVSIEMGIK
jgi:exodeoxyribonuclease-3